MKIQTFSIVAGGSACNAHCPFCISKMTPSQGVTQTKPQVNWRNFFNACLLAEQCGVTTVMITGKGEPTLYPEQITDYLTKLMESFDFPIIELQTNGIAIMDSPKKFTEYLKKWYELGLTTVSVSIAHYAAEKNREIYVPDRDKYFDLTVLVDRLHKLGFSVRISCVLANGYIDSEETLEDLIGICRLNGVEQLTLRPVNKPEGEIPDTMATWFDIHSLKREQYVRIAGHLKHIGHPLMKLIHGGLVYDVRGQNVCLGNSLTIDPKTEELRQLIFFPDGHLRYDWRYEGAILL